MQAQRQHLEWIEIHFDQVLDCMEKNEAEVQKIKRDVPQSYNSSRKDYRQSKKAVEEEPKRRVMVETRLEGIGRTMIGRIET